MLRQYQIDLIEQIRGETKSHRRILAVLPTGAGKTHIFCSIAKLSTQRNNNVLILVHRQELLQQTSARLTEMDVKHGIIAPGHKIQHAQVQIASIGSVARRLSQFPWSPNLVLVDEAHHCTAKSWQTVLNGYPNANIIGWTATPSRLDGRGLGEIFDHLVEGPTIRRLIDLGHLSRYRLYAPPSQVDRSTLRVRGGDYRREEIDELMIRPNVLCEAVANYQRYAAGKRAIAFCSTIRHAEAVRKSFEKANISAAVVDGMLATVDRQERIDSFKSGRHQVLISVDLISEGFDVPGCECVLLLRPTASLSVYLQQIGRALRPSDSEAIILDCAGNSAEHGLPCTERIWSLNGKARSRDMGQQALSVRVCASCYAVFRPAPECPYCGHLCVSEREMPREVQEALLEVDVQAAIAADLAQKKKSRAEVGRARTLEELQTIARQRGYRAGWAHAVMKSRKS